MCFQPRRICLSHLIPAAILKTRRRNPWTTARSAPLTPKSLREAIRGYPGIRSNIQFWDDEFNALPDLPRGNDETIQEKYVRRGMLYNWSFGIPTSI